MAIDKDKFARASQVLKEMARPFADTNPSEVVRVPWIFAERKAGEYPSDTDRTGKWLVFVDVEQLDDTWRRIKAATEQGILGSRAKSATSLRNPNAMNHNAKVICVYTYDWKDERDVKRVRAELRRLGIEKKISYKTDEDTLAGRHQVAGSKNIAKYYE
jgi:hypothetical protein